jgi:hypothetical protein
MKEQRQSRMDRPIRSEWAEFRRSVLADEHDPGLLARLREAFYAGALSCYGFTVHITELPASERQSTFDRLGEELMEFGRERVRHYEREESEDR